VQKHVYGRGNKAALDRGENLVYANEDTGKIVGIGPQVRTCKVHGREQLWLNFTPMLQGYSLNWAEGTVELGGKLYAGLLNGVGEATGGVSARHDLLLKLQKRYPKFQVWSSDTLRGCELPATRSAAGEPFPRVPSRIAKMGKSPN
jgi:hypothetical protein